MALNINTNIGALGAAASASAANRTMESAMERLSTGLRINTAADDAAGMAISSRMEAQIRGLNQAIRNAADGQALIDTTEGAHNEVTNILQRMRELAVQSANDTNVSADRANLQAEVNQLITEIDRIANQTTWNGVSVLDGTFSAKSFQIGADENQSITFSVGSVASSSIGSYTDVLDGLAAAAASTTAATNATTTTGTFSLVGHLGSGSFTVATGASAETIAGQINGKTDETGISATAKTVAKLHTLSVDGSVSMTVNGVSVAASANTQTDLRNLRDQINLVSGATGVTATVGGSDAELYLTSLTGASIVIGSYSNTGGATEALTIASQNGDGTWSADDIMTEGTDANGTARGYVKLSSAEDFTYTDAGASLGGNAGGTLAQVSNISVATGSGAASAITTIDAAINMINTARADLGAISNRLDNTISNLTNISTNISSSQSRIQDADFAAESTNLAKAQILQQAATAMLAQANASKQGVLSLLQG